MRDSTEIDGYELILNTFSNPYHGVEEIEHYQEYCSMLGNSFYQSDRIRIIEGFANGVNIMLTGPQFLKIDYELSKIIH